MPKVEMDVETSLGPAQVRSALIDFSPGRPDIWPGISRRYYEVYSVADTTADVREGTAMGPLMGFWAKEHYDWSDPQTVRWTVRASNFCAPGSYVAATIRARDGGGSRVHIEWNRTPTTFLGRMIARQIVRSNGKPVAGSFNKGLARMEKEHGQPAPASPA